MAHNLKQYQQILHSSTKIMAMVKAFSYGTGGFEIARLLEFHKVDYLGVAYVDEGVTLRKAGIRLPIIVMNTEESALAPLLEWRLEPVIYSFRGLAALQKLLKQEAVNLFPIHIELETGMNRLGFPSSQMGELSEQLKSGDFRVQSVFSHLAASEEAQQDEFTQKQFESYQSMAGRLLQNPWISISSDIFPIQRVLFVNRRCSWIWFASVSVYTVLILPLQEYWI